MPKAVLMRHDRFVFPDGAIVELTIWRLEAPVLGSRHTLKYSLYYGKDGRRLVAYDNERGKGDHRHIGMQELPYRFIDIDTLLADFEADVMKARGET